MTAFAATSGTESALCSMVKQDTHRRLKSYVKGNGEAVESSKDHDKEVPPNAGNVVEAEEKFSCRVTELARYCELRES